MKGLLGAVLGLIVLQVVTSSSNLTGLASVAGLPGQLAAKWMDPTVPLIPDRSTASASSNSGSGSVSTTTAGKAPAAAAAAQGRPNPASVASRF